MITKSSVKVKVPLKVQSSVKVQKSFKVEFTLDEREINVFCLLLTYGVSSVFDDEDLKGVIKDDDELFMRSVRDYFSDLRDAVERGGYVD